MTLIKREIVENVILPIRFLEFTTEQQNLFGVPLDSPALSKRNENSCYRSEDNIVVPT